MVFLVLQIEEMQLCMFLDRQIVIEQAIKSRCIYILKNLQTVVGQQYRLIQTLHIILIR